MYYTLMLAAALTSSPVGRTLHYVRSNSDGSRPEHVYVHRAAADRLEVYKMVERCTHAALVSAAIDPVTGEASRLEAATLLPEAQREIYGTITFDPAARTLRMAIDMDGKPVEATATVAARPWHLYDYDLATLTVAFQTSQPERRDFGLALVWIEQDRPVLRWLGAATANRRKATRHGGRPVWRYDVAGPALGSTGGGPLWIDRRDGTLVEARWRLPNHREFRDFRLRLVGEEAPGAAAWTALLTRHFADCPVA